MPFSWLEESINALSPAFSGSMELIHQFIGSLVYLSREMSIWLLIGFLFAGILNVFIDKKLIAKYLGGKRLKEILYGSLFGIPLPLCSCGVIPTGIAIYKNGASGSATVSFLISTPQTGVDSILATYSLMGLPFAIARPIVALFSGVLGGLITRSIGSDCPKNIQIIQTKTIQTEEAEEKFGSKIKKVFRYGFKEFFDDLAKWLFIGLLLAALMDVLIPSGFFAQNLDNSFLQMLMMLITAIPLYTCATGSIPIAGVLMMKGLSPGAALVFLMAGPATSIASIAVLGKALGKKNMIAYLLSIIGGAMFFGLLIDYTLPSEWFSMHTISEHLKHEHGGELLPALLQNSAAIALAALLLASWTRKIIIPKFFKAKPMSKDYALRIKIGGMNCQHCKTNVENRLNQIVEIERMEINLAQETATLFGTNISLEKVKEAVEEVGYSYQGEI